VLGARLVLAAFVSAELADTDAAPERELILR